ncbi:MAG: polymorphic toxin-type HINT domain-containing protein, partial [Pirellulales bacterium]
EYMTWGVGAGGGAAAGSSNCFVAGTKVLVPCDVGVAVTSMADRLTYTEADRASENSWFWTLSLVGVGIAGYAAAKPKSRREKKRRDRTLRALFGEDSDKLQGEDEGTWNMSPDDEHDYERRIDALCDALFNGDEFLGEAVRVGKSAAAAPSVGACVLAAETKRRRPTESERLVSRTNAARCRRDAGKRSPRATLKNRLATAWLMACLLLAAFVGLRPPAAPRRGGVPPAHTVASPVRSKHATRSIEDIRVGERVLGENPELAESEHSTRTAVDPETWRLVRLHADCRWQDGTLDPVEVESLQPFSWIEAHEARRGRRVPLPLDLTEMGLPADLPATVVAIEPCSPISDSLGHVVTTTVNHLNAALCDLSVADATGRRETINTTAFHKFYSDTRRGWVSASALREGEQLRGPNGALAVADVRRVPGVERVYNFSVEGEHVYHVSALGALVHNPNCVDFADNMANEMIQNGQHGEVVTLNFPLPNYGAVYNSAGQQVSTNGVHVGVQSGGLLYDNLSPVGTPPMQWIGGFQSPFGLGGVTIQPF